MLDLGGVSVGALGIVEAMASIQSIHRLTGRRNIWTKTATRGK
jgi:hypothetical protein